LVDLSRAEELFHLGRHFRQHTLSISRNTSSAKPDQHPNSGGVDEFDSSEVEDDSIPAICGEFDRCAAKRRHTREVEIADHTDDHHIITRGRPAQHLHHRQGSWADPFTTEPFPR
jgi:hypothetical protein